MPGLGNKMPDAILEPGIMVRIVRRRYSAHGCNDFVLAAALFAVVTIFVKRETVVTRALVRSYCVPALVLTASVVVGTFVHVREENRGETSLLDAMVDKANRDKRKLNL